MQDLYCRKRMLLIHQQMAKLVSQRHACQPIVPERNVTWPSHRKFVQQHGRAMPRPPNGEGKQGSGL